MKRKLLTIALASSLLICSCGQNGENKTNDCPKDNFCSTVINSDSTITFNYQNQSAKQVLVDVQFAGRHEMKKDSSSGIWSVTLGPAAPDMYPYCFVVDGVSIMDPCCDQWFANEGFKNSLLEIEYPNSNLIHSFNAGIDHCTVDYINYYSNAIKAYNNAVVILPPNYSKDKKYPVFYLISGTTDTEEVYLKVGRANVILENLISQNLCKEMIIVLPYGNPAKLTGSVDMLGSNDLFSNDLNNDLMPYIESHYSTLNDRENRAIGGFSRGGNQALYNGLTHLDKFSYLCSYSSFTSTEIPEVYNNAKQTNSKINLFWLGVGTDDFLYGTARNYTEFLDQKGITCVKEYTSDKFGHTWMNAKYFLDITLRLVFNKEASQNAMANAKPTKEKTGQEKDFTPGVMARLFPKPIISPEFLDNKVTFRIKAPNAQKVMLEGEFASSPIEMTKDTSGIFFVTLDNITPDVYCYNFDVDGLKVCDAQNMYLAHDNGFKRSILNMPNEPYAINNKKIDYQAIRYDYLLYPKIYIGHQSSSKPIIVLHAMNDVDDMENFIKVGHVNQIYEQLLAEGKCDSLQFIIEDKACCNGDLEVIAKDDKMTWAEFRKYFANELTNRKTK